MCKIMSSHKHILRSLGNGPARRSLFGPVDREQLQQEYHHTLCKDLEDASCRWGFDFLTEKPLEGGDFQWEGVPGAQVPALYRSCLVGEGSRVREPESRSATAAAMGVAPGSSASGKANAPRTPDWHKDGAQNMENTPQKRNSLKRKQTNLKDFYEAKKRVVGTPRKSGCSGLM